MKSRFLTFSYRFQLINSKIVGIYAFKPVVQLKNLLFKVHGFQVKDFF